MIYQTGKMLLQETQELFRGPVNDCVVCRDLTAKTLCYYTLIIIKDNETSRKFLQIYSEAGEQGKSSIVSGFSWQNSYIAAFLHRSERPFEAFAATEINSLAECEELAMNVVMECMASGIPYPILYLQLTQQQLHLTQDKQLYFGYKLDLGSLDEKIGEQECVRKCADILFRLIDRQSGARNASHKLLRLKTQRQEYRRFTELYKDLKAAAKPIEKEAITKGVIGFFKKRKQFFFKLLTVLSSALAIAAIVMIITQAIFGDLPFMRVFYNPFRVIGTESMLQ